MGQKWAPGRPTRLRPPSTRAILGPNPPSPKMNAKWPPHDRKMDRKWCQNDPKMEVSEGKNAPFFETGAQEKQSSQKNCLPSMCVALFDPKISQKSSNMAPTYPPKTSKNRLKTDVKKYQDFDSFGDRFLERFWWIFGAKIEPSWDNNGMENRYRR